MRGRKKSQTKREIYISKRKKKQKKKESPLLGIFRSLCHLKKNTNFAPKNELSPFGGMKGEREGVVVVCEYSALWSHL